MIHNLYITFLIFLLGWFVSCVTPPQEIDNLYGTWICQYQDKTMQLPFPNAIHFVDDSIALWLKEDLQTCEAKWHFTDNYLTIDTAVYSILKFTKEHLTLELNEEEYHYVKGIDKQPKQDFDFKNRFWKKAETKGEGIAIMNQYGLVNDTLWQQQSYFYQNDFLHRQNRRCIFQFDQLENSVFLVEALLEENNDTSKRRVRQIVEWEEQSFKTSPGYIHEEKGFYQESDSFSIDRSFSRCKGGGLAHFQWAKTTYNGGKPKLEEHFFEQYKTINTDESGFITIRFTINCHGQIGDFELEQCDSEFKPVQFSKEIITQLFQLTNKLNDWKVGKNEEKENVDSRFFVGFKIEQGRLVGILP